MATQQLKDSYGKLLGRIEEQNGRLRGFDAYGRYKGYYDPKPDKTYDAYGRFIGSGNTLAVLILNP